MWCYFAADLCVYCELWCASPRIKGGCRTGYVLMRMSEKTACVWSEKMEQCEARPGALSCCTVVPCDVQDTYP